MGGGSGERGHMYTCGWFMLIYSRNLYSIVKQLSSNKKKKTVNLKKFFFVFGKLTCIALYNMRQSTLINLKFWNPKLLMMVISSVTQLYATVCDPMKHSTPGLPAHHQPPEFTETHVHRVSHATQPSHPLSSPSPPAHNPSQHQSLFQWSNSSHEVAKIWSASNVNRVDVEKPYFWVKGKIQIKRLLPIHVTLDKKLSLKWVLIQ